MTLPLASRRLAIPAALLLLAAAASAARPARQAQPIRIELTPAGLVVTPSQLIVEQGDPLEWSSELPFAIAVERNGELFGRPLPPQSLRGRASAPVRASVAGSAPVSSYKYSVAVWDGENVWVVDPEIVVRPSGR